MNVAVKHILACAILLAISQSIRAEYDVDAYCTLVKNGIKLASIDNCETFYTCNNGVATKGVCQSSQAFDKNSQSCKPKSDVSCYLNNEQPCQLKNEGFVPVVGTCNMYIYCKNYKEVGRGMCPNGQIFYEDGCAYGNCNENINQGNDGLNSVCQIMKDNLFFGSTKDCMIWQKCVKGELFSDVCPKGFVFDIQIEQCNYESGNMCSRVTGQDIQPDPTPQRPCTINDKGTVDPDSTTCSVWYTCDGSKWVKNTCGMGLFYSVINNKCELRQYATPATGCNRCEFSKKQFVNAVDPSCRKYLRCDNGKLVSNKGSCDADSYFDEASQACMGDKVGNHKIAYAQSNGACFNCEITCQSLSIAACIPKSGCACYVNAAKACNVCTGLLINGVCEENPTCNQLCGTLQGSQCVADDTCNCYLNSSKKCVECDGTIEKDGTCTTCETKCNALSGNKCVPDDDCDCAIDEASNECIDCQKEIVAGKCVDGDTCEAKCSALAAASCKPDDTCNCAIDEDTAECIECVGTITSGKCITSTPPDCENDCKALGVDNCADGVTDCTCGVNEGECADCSAGNDCNGCICAGSDCPAGETDCECYEDATNVCTYCPNGVNTDGDDCNA